MTEFHNYGGVCADVVIQVGGDLYNLGPVQPARRAAADLRRSVRRCAGLDRGKANQVRAALAEIEVGLQAGRPDAGRVADALRRLATLLKEAGALAAAGASLRELATWLGPLGAGVLTLLA